MLSNAVLETKIASLKQRKTELSKLKNEIALQIKKGGVSKQAYWKARRGMVDIPSEDIEKHEKLTVTYQEAEKEICEIKEQLHGLFRQQEASKNIYILQILSEIFNENQLREINREADRRVNGEPAEKVIFNLDTALSMYDQAEKYKKLYAGEIDKIQEIRIILNRVIEEGCKQFGDADFLKVVSPLNRFILPLNELKKLKRQLFPRDLLTK